jgi:hypothetical protein
MSRRNWKSAAAAMSPAVADIETGIKGVQLTVREDGSVTMRLMYRGLAAKQLTMFPLQWEALAEVAGKLKGRFGETGKQINLLTADVVDKIKGKLLEASTQNTAEAVP